MNAYQDDRELPPIPSQIPNILGIFPLKETVVFPAIPAQLSCFRPQTVQLITDVMQTNRLLGLMTLKKADREVPIPSDLCRVGTAAFVQRMWHLPDGSLRLIVHGICRISLKRTTATTPYISARVEALPSKGVQGKKVKALAVGASGLFQKIASVLPHLPDELQIAAINIDDPVRLADFVAFHLSLKTDEKQAILEDLDVRSRLRRLTVWMSQELEVLDLSAKIQSQVQIELDKNRRDYLLREQIRVLQQELGEQDERAAEADDLRSRILAAGMSSDAQREAERELDRLVRLPLAASEYTVCRTYLNWLVELPWNRTTQDNLDLRRVSRVLNRNHHGLGKVKERILEYLAVRRLNPQARGPVLCLVGPPGVGKTSLGRAVAQAMGRRFVRLALGGLRDEAELRGHRRTYVGALPGQIIQGIHRANARNPVFMLDELDKMSRDFRGDPATILLELLDAEQNAAFTDHYLGMPFDLSGVLFIATANVLSDIPDALRDRLEVLELPGYTEEEKLWIARKHMLPRQIEAHGLTRKHLTLTTPAIRHVIDGYTQEAGLRGLERAIGAICRRLARQVAEGETRNARLDVVNLEDYLGCPRFLSEIRERKDEPGVATGLATTQAGGQIFFVESIAMSGRQDLILTGQLGSVMRESAQAALSYVRAHSDELGIDADGFSSKDIHVHVPAGAVPKDGPSAGVTIAASLASLLSGRPVRSNLAMTGEITLRGRVLPVGGIKDKVLAARRAGIRRVILPEKNRPDLSEIPASVLKRMRFDFVQTVGEVFAIALRKAPFRRANGD